MAANPFNDPFETKMDELDAVVEKDFKNYSNLMFAYGYNPAAAEPEDSFERTTETIRFDELIWGTEDGD
jgi:hypothetical protein